MVKTMREFKDELETLRREIHKGGEYADPVLLASWMDRLVISLESFCESVDLMQERVDVMSLKGRKMAKFAKGKGFKKTKKTSWKKAKKTAGKKAFKRKATKKKRRRY